MVSLVQTIVIWKNADFEDASLLIKLSDFRGFSNQYLRQTDILQWPCLCDSGIKMEHTHGKGFCYLQF